MQQYTKYIKNEVTVISIFSLAGITIIGGFLNLGNTLGLAIIDRKYYCNGLFLSKI